MNRREALKKGALLSTGALVAPQIIANHHVHKFRIGACDWSIKQMLELEAFHLGKELGLETWFNEDDHRHILESVDSPAVKVYYDVANSNKMGYDIYQEIESLGSENICEIHCKENGFLLGRGRIAFERLRGVLKKIDYRGWLIIESAVPKGMAISRAYRHNADYLRSVF